MSMVVGVCEFGVSLVGVRSLKEKRGIIRRIIGRTRSRFHVAIAEIDDQDVWDYGRIGFAVVGSDRRLVNSIIDKVIDHVENQGLAPVTDHDYEILSY